jgi:poly(hydroxyalkanoate) depolymerase family esterase
MTGSPEWKAIEMHNNLARDLLQATQLTKSGRLAEATAALQRMLSGEVTPGTTNARPRRDSLTIDGMVEAVGAAETMPAADAGPIPTGGIGERPFGVPGTSWQQSRPVALRGFLDQINQRRFQAPDGGSHLPPATTPDAVPNGGQFLALIFDRQRGSRPYKLYIPSGYRGLPVPLIVMLHGCTQSADDFAAGTRMNELGEQHSCLVAYPEQTSSANMQKCWNWFSESDQQRGRGEPSLIAGITLEVMRDYAIDPQRVYVAGLSAGGAAAAVMGDAYPDLYAAIGVHSGLPCGAARDMPSAFAAMQRGSGGPRHLATGASRAETERRVVPAIVFHGDKDTTVNPRNGDAVVTQSARAEALSAHAEEGRIPGGHAYRRILHVNASGQTVIEQWTIHGAGHAWSGGSSSGSYTDPRGPDAAGEMLRFFLEHPHPRAKGDN